jgi:hypothetical protein
MKNTNKKILVFSILFLLILVPLISAASTPAECASGVCKRINHGGDTLNGLCVDTVCYNIKNNHASNDYFIPTVVADFNSFSSNLPSGITIEYNAASIQRSGCSECAKEGGTCYFNGAAVISYGRYNYYNTVVAARQVACTNAVFGDPYTGKTKYCYIGGDCYTSSSDGGKEEYVGPTYDGSGYSGTNFDNWASLITIDTTPAVVSSGPEAIIQYEAEFELAGSVGAVETTSSTSGGDGEESDNDDTYTGGNGPGTSYDYNW